MRKLLASLLTQSCLVAALAIPTVAQAQSAVAIDADDIGGVVSSAKGPEAGVWVIAETKDLGNRFVKIVVTDDQGRYVLPDLPAAKYKVWVRGYGLVDSKQVDGAPGKALNLSAVVAPTPKAAAEYYPANYWLSLLRVPAESEFPGTGPQGNGISPTLRNQQDWVGHLKENCEYCHQLGTKPTRELEAANSVEGWDMRVRRERANDDMHFTGNANYKMKAPDYGTAMTNNMSRFGRPRALKMFADWTDRIGKGEVPAAPPRPVGVERNVVLTMWDLAGDHFVHDHTVTDKRNPTVNANGPIFALAQHYGAVVALDPKTGKQTEQKLVELDGKTWSVNLNNHTAMMDERARVWMSTQNPSGYEAPFCNDAALSPYAKLYGRTVKGGRTIGVYDPKTQKSELIPVCYSTHHLNFTHKGDILFHSGDTEVMGWIDTKVWDQTHDAAKAVGWCPMVLDTNGDGKIEQDRTKWNNLVVQTGGGEAAAAIASDKSAADKTLDPKKDTRINGFLYGMGVSPLDDSMWASKFMPYVPSGIVRFERGAHPPETCKTEYYEPPMVNGKYLAFNNRGVDVDAKGVAWVAFGTGQIGSFDRSKCKVTSGPTATGQQCPEGWHIYDTPGPKLAGTNVGSDWFYQTFVDHHDTSGLGKETPIFPSSASDALLAYLPASNQMVQLRVPYPMGFYARGVDGRIDDPKAGWKGRGLWASNNILTMWHQEGGEGTFEGEEMVKFQVRPDPLAH